MSDSNDGLPPVGNYTARAVAGSEQYGRTQNGDEKVAIDLQIEGGEFEGATMTLTLFFSEKAAPYSVSKLRKLGWRGNDITNLDGIDANAVSVRVYDDAYQGTTTRKIDVQGGGGGTFRFKETMNERDKKAFSARLMGLAKTTPAPNAAADDFPASYSKPVGGIKY